MRDCTRMYLVELVAYSMLDSHRLRSRWQVSLYLAGNPIIRERPPCVLDTTARTNRDSLLTYMYQELECDTCRAEQLLKLSTVQLTLFSFVSVNSTLYREVHVWSML